MKKITLILAVFAVLLSMVSAATKNEYSAEKGMNAPYFEVEAFDGDVISLSDMKGRFVIVNFWTSDDAASRIAANQYSSFVESVGEEHVGLVSINFDRNQRLFEEIMRRDGLSVESQFYVQPGNASELIRKFNMGDGLQSFLIDPNGTIAAINPSAKMLASILNK